MNASTHSPEGHPILNNFVAVLKKFADFNGRARHSEYGYFFLVNVLATVAFNILGVILNGAAVVALLSSLYFLVVLVPSVAVAVRRMHKSGWFVLIPVYNLILACTGGTAGENKYGADPKK